MSNIGKASPSLSVVGLILARKGSQKIRNKNLSILNGQPLIIRCLEVMKNSGCFKQLWVSTDDQVIGSKVELFGASVHWRATYTATDEAPSVVAVSEFLETHEDVENVCLVQCTSPFLKPSYLCQGLELFNEQIYDSVFSVTRRKLLRWSQKLPCEPLNFDAFQRPRRQDMTGDVCENGMFYFTTRKLVQKGRLQGSCCAYVFIGNEDSLDIDTPQDLFVTQQILLFRSREN